MHSPAILASLCALVSVLPAADPIPPPQPVSGAGNALDVVYLPERISGSWSDRWLKMNVHWPAGDQARPCIIFVHGGGYGGGDKDGRYAGANPPPRELIERAVKSGYTAVNLNYIMGRGISPQVFWDFKTAVRFLRSHAKDYRIDPDRIAAWGFSAGGWLSSSAGFSSADDRVQVRVALSSLTEKEDPKRFLELPYDDPAAPPQSSRLSVIVADFWKNPELHTQDDPHLLTYTGTVMKWQAEPRVQKSGGLLSYIVLTADSYKKTGLGYVHVPDSNSPVLALADGTPSKLDDEVFRWLDKRLIAEPRCLAPEARPNQRIFRETVVVTLIGTTPGTSIRYTTDGSDPIATSPVAKEPLKLNATTTIKAIVSSAGQADSAVASFAYTKGEPPPTITAPAAGVLPPGKVGQPYTAAFTADTGGGPVLWSLAGHLQIGRPPNGPLDDPSGLHLDPVNGVLSGTPTAPGTFTFQVHCTRGVGQIADARVYVVVIKY